MNFLVTKEQKLGTSSHQALPEHSPVMQEQICLYGDGGYSIGAAFEHFLCSNPGDFDLKFCTKLQFS